MNNKSLAVAFGDSLKEDTVSCVSELAEIGLDAMMDDGILKDVPILSTAVALYKIGNSFKDRHNIKKLITFLNEINNGIPDSRKRNEYQQKFQSNDKFRNQEIEYLFILIDRYISYNKPQMLAKLYLAYLDNIIIWEELTMYAEIIDKLLLPDFKILISDTESIVISRNIGGESVLRLVALGLMAEESSDSLFEDDGGGGFSVTEASMRRFEDKERKYVRTEFGNKLASILR